MDKVFITRERLEQHCEDNDFKLSDNADEIIAEINKNDGLCPFRLDGYFCICKFHIDEIRNTGQCKGGLILGKKEY